MAKKKNTGLNMALLASIVAATAAGSFMYVSAADAAPFVAQNLVEQNVAMADAAGNLATRATEAGVKMSAGNVAPSAPAPKPSFNIVMTSPPVMAKRGRVGESLYPFEQLAAPVNGQMASFFVSATVARPEPWKSLASTVSGATRRYAEQNGMKDVKRKDDNGNEVTVSIANLVPTRRFTVREQADGAAWGHPGVKGAVIYRTA